MSSYWIEFLDKVAATIAEWDSDGCDFPVFRGHANETWDLEPSMMRLRRHLTEDEYDRLESVLYFDFVTYSARHSHLASSWEVLFEMRHHGLPTRLLDWSESFAMALYFALGDAPESPTVWLLNPFRLNEVAMNESSLMNPITGLKFNYEQGYLDDDLRKTEVDMLSQSLKTDTTQPYQKPIAIVPPLSSDRLFAQKGLFTLQGKNDDTPLNLIPGFSDCFVKCSIPRAAIPDAYRFVQLAGVNEFSAYPDLDGLSRHLQMKYKIRDLDLKARRTEDTGDSKSELDQHG